MRQLMYLVASVVLLTWNGTEGSAATVDNPGTTPADTTTKQEPASNKPKDLIVGVWEIVSKDPKEKGTMEFRADGSFTIAPEIDGKTITMNGKYKFTAEDVIEVEVVPTDSVPPLKQKLKLTKITRDELVTKDEKNMEDKFKKK